MAAVLLAGAVFPSFAQDDAPKVNKWVLVKEPLKNIYVSNDNPKSDIIRQTKPREYIDLITEGETWHRVRVDGKVGFLEARYVQVVNRKGGSVLMILLYIILLGGCAGGAVYYIKKQQKILTR
jgi:uncharacterized pyridoxamine 5'-phosphate oxidase family protein